MYVSLAGTSFFAIWNLTTILHHKPNINTWDSNPHRKIQDMYVLVPALNEQTTIKKTIDGLILAADKVNAFVHIIPINDASTDYTPQILASYSNNPQVHVITRNKPDAQTGKGNALNRALHYIELQNHNPNKTIVGVIDSDTTINSNLLAEIEAPFIYTDYDLVQTAIGISNQSSFLTKMQGLEFGVTNFLTQILRTGWGSAISSGNGQFMTLKMASAVRWHNSLLDDLEFSLNGIFQNYKGLFLSHTSLPQQGVQKYWPFIRQRVRWCQGGMECLFRYWKQIITTKNISTHLKWDLLLFLCVPFASLLFMAGSFLSIFVFIWELQYIPLFVIEVVAGLIITGTTITLILIQEANRLGSSFTRSSTFPQEIVMAMENFAYA
ncbi:glycosyltransferase family 2 protein [Lentilactobacillus sp. Marseille-Q4993]|uniref:glycosyltransferase family 2 protein n=1 Tax=Lentilactobacillus sp. Marseille-Q4993 TaxID=3039492 RepID=UPI0024BCF756|nr:glycosyltransferase family 2 protein [Lentilactobacillus sp. Marseille-Q4993]